MTWKKSEMSCLISQNALKHKGALYIRKCRRSSNGSGVQTSVSHSMRNRKAEIKARERESESEWERERKTSIVCYNSNTWNLDIDDETSVMLQKCHLPCILLYRCTKEPHKRFIDSNQMAFTVTCDFLAIGLISIDWFFSNTIELFKLVAHLMCINLMCLFPSLILVTCSLFNSPYRKEEKAKKQNKKNNILHNSFQVRT